MIPSKCKQHRRSRGFTLIELVIVMGIIGLLSSMAIPGYTGIFYRVKAAEREGMIRNIETAVKAHFVNDEKLPGGGSTWEAQWNPPYDPAIPQPQFWDKNEPGWHALSFEVDTTMHYRYYATGTIVGGQPLITLVVLGDLNKDAVWQTTLVTLQRGNSGDWTRSQTTTPPDGTNW